MKVKHYSGSVVDVTKEKAQVLTASSMWRYAEEPPQEDAETSEEGSEGEATQDAPSLPQEPSQGQEQVTGQNELQAEDGSDPAPSIPEIRKWALENDVEGAKPQGKLSKAVIDAYMAAHKE
jgi:hypothetical protein